MASTGTIKTLNATTIDILNAIRNSATANYKDYVPAATDNASVREIGAIIMNYPALQNEFLSALVNRIGMVMMTSKTYSNPWAMFKKGTLEFGETVEEIFVNIAKPFEYDPVTSETEVFKRVIPDVRASFHILNYQKFYKTTVSQDQLRQAFLNIDGVSNLITKIIDSMYTGANYDEFQTMKYMLARHILDGDLYPVTVNSEGTPAQFVSKIKSTSNSFEFMSSKYNRAHVHNFSVKNDQYLVVNSIFDASMDVEVLASAFNMDKASFAGHRVLVDSFGEMDTDRLTDLFGETEWYVELTESQLEALDAIPAVLVDKEWFMILDNMMNFTEQYNSQGLYWNYFYHTWKTFSASPFANAAVFVPGTPSVTAVTVSPTTVTVLAGQSVQLKADVSTSNFASKAVDWAIDQDDNVAVIDIYGNLYVKEGAAKNTVIKATATSVYDSTKKATCTVTVG
jgi:hypothetical protein